MFELFRRSNSGMAMCYFHAQEPLGRYGYRGRTGWSLWSGLGQFFFIGTALAECSHYHRKKWHHHTREPAIAGFCLQDGRHGERRWREKTWPLDGDLWRGTWQVFMSWELNLFHASHWISEPATAATAGCGFSSYVALLGFRLQWCSVDFFFGGFGWNK